MGPEELIAAGLLTAEGDGVAVRVHVQPRASQNGLVGVHGDRVKIRTTAPPVDGKANELIAVLLAQVFRVPRRAVSLTGGPQSRQKRFRVAGLGLEPAAAALAAALPG
ncbi:MAG: DUF167 family protein [Desulfobacteraceae bacterium]|nr:DUF167 family protein [Desulfobacteraceae bacterium]